MTYIAVFKDNKFAKFDTIEEVQQLPYVEYIFKKELLEVISNTYYNYSLHVN